MAFQEPKRDASDKYREVQVFRDDQTNATATVTQSTETGEYTVKFGKQYKERDGSQRQTAFLTVRQLGGVTRLVALVERWIAEQLKMGE